MKQIVKIQRDLLWGWAMREERLHE